MKNLAWRLKITCLLNCMSHVKSACELSGLTPCRRVFLSHSGCGQHSLWRFCYVWRNSQAEGSDADVRSCAFRVFALSTPQCNRFDLTSSFEVLHKIENYRRRYGLFARAKACLRLLGSSLTEASQPHRITCLAPEVISVFFQSRLGVNL